MSIVQGLTEFLPVSSSGHLRIVSELFWGNDAGASFTAVIQLGTELAVLVFFAKDIWRILTAWFAGLAELLGGALLIVGFAVPIVAIVLIIDMLGAIFTVHIDSGFFATGGGIELPLVLIAGLLAVAAVPQTSLGIDALLLKNKLEGAK